MGTATAPVRGSGDCPAWIARVAKPRFLGSPFTRRILAAPSFIGTIAGTVRYRRHEPRSLKPRRSRVYPDPLGGRPPAPPRTDPPAGRGGVDRLHRARAG